MTSSGNRSDFQADWGFPSEVRTTIHNAGVFDVRPCPGTYKSGRPKFQAIFLSHDRKSIVARRDAMELTSKKTGLPYFVCRRQENWKQAEAARAVDAIMSKPRDSRRVSLELDDVFP